MKKLIILALIASLFSATSFAEEAALYSGKELYDYCRQSEDSNISLTERAIAKTACSYFIQGLIFGYSAGSGKTPVYCVPEQVTFGQISQVYMKFASETPEMLNQHAGVVLLFSLAKAFPCPKQGR